MTAEAQRIAIQKMIDRRTAAATRDRETARQTLIKEGVYTSMGALSANFGGKKTAA